MEVRRGPTKGWIRREVHEQGVIHWVNPPAIVFFWYSVVFSGGMFVLGYFVADDEGGALFAYLFSAILMLMALRMLYAVLTGEDEVLVIDADTVSWGLKGRKAKRPARLRDIKCIEERVDTDNRLTITLRRFDGSAISPPKSILVCPCVNKQMIRDLLERCPSIAVTPSESYSSTWVKALHEQMERRCRFMEDGEVGHCDWTAAER